MNNRFLYLTLLIVSIITFSCSNKTNVENTNTTKLGIAGLIGPVKLLKTK